MIGLKYYDDFNTPIPRKFITVLSNSIKYLLRTQIHEKIRIVVAGSYRRKYYWSGDIDILMSSSYTNLDEIVEILKKYKVVTDIISLGKEKFMGVAKCPSGTVHVRLDIEFVKSKEFGAALLYFTGSRSYNLYLRTIAKNKGYTLNQHGLFKGEERVSSVNTEKQIVEFLGEKYLHPEDRL